MKIFSRFMCLTIVVIMLGYFCCENIVLAGNTDKSVQAFEKMSDEYMKKVLNDYKVAGVTVSVVKDGKVFFKKGYGYADVEKKIPVNPDTTAFQIASVSKLLTATAAMQLVDQGKLSLDEDVNKYLTDFKIKNKFSKPVTLRMLLAHTAGLDDKIPLYYKSTGEKFYDSIEPLGIFLKENMPPVVREPGTYWQYSVYGFALVGYLVEKTSGIKIENYITDNILNPLDMKHSAYWLNKDILSNMTKPYKHVGGKYLDGAYTICEDHPSGAICATASDMANFMIMHLNNGQYNGKRVLNESTAKDMHKRNYARDVKLLGFGLGFMENNMEGYNLIGHGGYLPSFSSLLSLMPDKNIGVFISLNTDSKYSGKIRNEFTSKAYEFFLGKVKKTENQDVLKTNIKFDMDVKKINGNYGVEGNSETDLLKIKSVIPGTSLNLKCSNNGVLTITSGNDKFNYKYVGNGLFYNKEENQYCKITENNNKTIFSIGFTDSERIPSLNIYLFYGVIAGVLIFIATSIGTLISIFRNRKSNERQSLIFKLILLTTSILMISYIVLNAFMAIRCMNADTSNVYSIITPMIKGICCLSLISTAFSIGYFISLWIKGQFSLKAKVSYEIIIIFAINYLVFMYIMNGFKI